jgi:uncharacterized membrane protein
MEYLIDSISRYTLYQLLWFFVFYSVGGWCLEVVYHVVNAGHFVNRGFLNGPVCPIYGFGMIIIIICLMPLRENKLLLFAGSVVLATLLELITGFLLEKIFHQRWWDYSNEPFNLKGYICPKFSLEWGVACLLVTDILHPALSAIIRHIPKIAGMIILGVMLVIFVTDCIVTVISVQSFNKRLKAMYEIEERIKNLSVMLGESLTDATLQGMEKKNQVKQQLDEKSLELRQYNAEKRAETEVKLAELKEKLARLRTLRKFGHRRLIRTFPALKNRKFAPQLEQLKETVRKNNKRRLNKY